MYTLELLPKDDAAVVWGKIVMIVSKEYMLPTNIHYYDEDNLLIRTLLYKNFQQLSDRMYPTYWEMLPKTKDKKDHKTIVIVDEAEFNKQIDASYFTKRALKRYSK
jgi:outer membrane lipoprotein-sorting protein